MLRAWNRMVPPLLLVLAGTTGAAAQAKESCIYAYRLEPWYYPEVLAELTQVNGSRSRAELDSVARELVRSAAEPDADAVVETIQTHFADGIRSDLELWAACMARNGDDVDDFDIDAAAARAIEGQRDDAAWHASVMANLTLELAAHRSRPLFERHIVGTPYAGASDAAERLFDVDGGGSRLMRNLDRERAAAVFERAALRPGPAACHALRNLKNWDEENLGPNGWQPRPHPSYERLRRESPERCPELDDPGG